MTTVPAVTVGSLIGPRSEAIGLTLELLAGGAGLDRRITSPYIQKTGLALAGFHEYLQPGRILIFGDSELRFLESMPAVARQFALAKSFEQDVPCLIITGRSGIPADLLEAAQDAGMPVLASGVPTAATIGKITALLEDRLAVRELVHGVLVDILGLGVLLVGDSGIGKSECALDLVCRGHRLVADDTVEVRRRAESFIIGSCPELTRHHMEVRGIGLINVRDLFGVAATRTSKRIELVVQIERWDGAAEYERIGLDDQYFEILGLRIPLVRMPIAPGRNMATLVEVAARNQLLRARGIHAARRLASRLDASLRAPSTVDSDRDDDDSDNGEMP